MRRPTVVLAEPIHPEGVRLLKRRAKVISLPEPTSDALQKTLATADGLIVRLLRVTGETVQWAPRLRVVGCHGVGVDNIDLEACTRRRIPVVYLPHSSTEAVAEHTVALLLGLAKRLTLFDPATREGRFGIRWEVPAVELRGKRIGIVGMGSIGYRVARICHALEMEVIVFDPYLSPERRPGWARWASTLEDLLGDSDVISLHVPLTPETHHLVGARELALMRPQALLVNTARGAVVDEKALVAALQDRRIGGAALDVYQTEPIAPDNPLLRLPNVLLTPHVAAHTEDTLRRMAVLTVEEVLTVLGDGRPRWLANPELVQGAGGSTSETDR